MKTYTALYCAITEDGGIEVAELEADSFVEAARLAVHRAPPTMKLYQLEEQPGQMTELEIEDTRPMPEVARAPKQGRRKWRDKP